MAKAGRQRVIDSQSTKTVPETVSSDKAEHAAPSVQPALSVSSQNLIILDPHDTGSSMEQILPASNKPKEIMPARQVMADSELNMQTLRSEARARDPLSEQPHRTQASVVNDTADIEKQRVIEQDREKLQRLREIVAQMGGLFCADILSHIETLEGRLSPSATADLEAPHKDQTALLLNVSPLVVIAQADPESDKAAHNTVTARQELPPDAISLEHRPVQVQAGPSVRHNSISSINTTEAAEVSAAEMTETATVTHKNQRILVTDAKSTATATASMHIKGVKQNTVKIGAIFGEHIQMSHFLARPSHGSTASSVANPADDIGPVSASVSQITLQQKDSSRSIPTAHPTTTETAATNEDKTQPPKSPEEKRIVLSQSKPTALGSLEDATARQSLPESTTALSPPAFNKPSTSDEPTVTPRITMRKDPKLAENVFTRQYSSHVPVSPQVLASSQSRVANKPSPASDESTSTSSLTVHQPEFKDNSVFRRPATRSHDSTELGYASANPFAQQQGSVEVSSIQSGFSARNDTSPFLKRFNTAPYRRDEASPRADRIKDSSAAKPTPKIPSFLRTLRPETQDPGAAARRQYQDPVSPHSASGIPSERVSQQMIPAQASSIRSGFQNVRASITLSNPLVERPSQGSATSENLRPSNKGASQNVARRGPK